MGRGLGGWRGWCFCSFMEKDKKAYEEFYSVSA